MAECAKERWYGLGDSFFQRSEREWTLYLEDGDIHVECLGEVLLSCRSYVKNFASLQCNGT